MRRRTVRPDARCRLDTDCIRLICLDGLCQAPPGCVVDADCGPGEICLDGVCLDGQCRVDGTVRMASVALKVLALTAASMTGSVPTTWRV